jgi:ArsR family transcriptional regulator
VRKRDARTREFFSAPRTPESSLSPCVETPAYLFALASLLPGNELAVDAGTGDGALLDVLAPLFRRVVAVDRSDVQLARAARRVAFRGYDNVTLLRAELDDDAVLQAAGGRASVVVASRMLHHAPQPRAVLRSLAALLRPAGHLFVIDYERHADEALRERQADVWNGFEPDELEALARGVGLVDASVVSLPAGFVQNAADGHVRWQVLRASRPPAASAQGPAPDGDGVSPARVSVSALPRGRSRLDSPQNENANKE